jgi:hypothetical protein
MKLFFYACFIFVSIAACNSAEKRPEVVKMDPKEINVQLLSGFQMQAEVAQDAAFRANYTAPVT